MSSLDLSRIPENDIITKDSKAYLKIDVNEKIYRIFNRPAVAIVCSEQCLTPSNVNFSIPLTQFIENMGANGSSNTTSPASAQNGLDISNLNSLGYQPKAVKPIAAVIAMKSNVFTYGPYTSFNYFTSSGGANVEVNTELCPWVYGSISAMNDVGNMLAQANSAGLSEAETGSVTVVGLPEIGALGPVGGGTNLSSISFTYGASGTTTTYDFRTFTPKFGTLSRYLSEKIKNIAKNRTAQLKFLRSNQIIQNKISRKLRNINQKGKAGKPNKKGTLQRLIVGQMYDWKNLSGGYSQRTVVGFDTFDQSPLDLVENYSNKAVMSIDGLLTPVSINGDGGLPRYSNYEVRNHKSSPEAPNPPCTSGDNIDLLKINNLEISRQYANPLTNLVNPQNHHHTGDGKGHVIDIVGQNTTLPQDGVIGNFKDDNSRYTSDYRFLALKGPLVLQSWGYDTNGKPIPNEADSESDAKSGKFKNDNLKDKFYQNWLSKPATWPSAPVDLRYDRQRGMWVSPPSYKIITAKLTANLDAYGSCSGILVNNDKNKAYGHKIYDENGVEIQATADEKTSKAKIKLVDRIGNTHNKGDLVYAYYDTHNSEYIILGGSSSSKSIRFKLIDRCDTNHIGPNYGDDWTAAAGYRDKFPNNHILGVRINCDGEPVDNDGQIITSADLDDADKRSKIYVNLYDNAGQHGPAYAAYSTFEEWKTRAFNGIAVPIASGSGSSSSSCSLGNSANQCSPIDQSLPSYDIVFLESYARFIECILAQDLYPDAATLANYADDEYKIANPQGNASARISEYYGNSANGKEPKFYKSDGTEIYLRVFDPFKDFDSNPFSRLKTGDKVLAIFDDTKKKYIIYQSLDKSSANKIVKFALVDDKTTKIPQVRGIRVNNIGLPVDDNDNVIVDQGTFINNFIVLKDPYAIRGPNFVESNSTFGPALGSDNLNEHINGIILGDSDSDNVIMYPFIGFAVTIEASGSSYSPGGGSPSSSFSNSEFHIVALEQYARYVTGKIATTWASANGHYLGVRNGFTEGRKPVARNTNQLGPGQAGNRCDLMVANDITDFNGRQSYIVGDFIDQTQGQSAYGDVDGCKFIAALDNISSDTYQLIYRIIESETIALRGQSEIKSDGNVIKALNGLALPPLFNGSCNEDNDAAEPNISSTYFQGFQWDKNKSRNKHYANIKINNRDGFIGKNLINIGSKLYTELDGIDRNTGNPIYKVINIDHVGKLNDKVLTGENSGKFGFNNIHHPQNNNRFLAASTYYDGIKPPDNNSLKTFLANNEQFMTFDGSRVISVLDSENYVVLRAQEAPVIFTGKAAAKINASAKTGISITIEGGFPSSQGMDKAPITTIIQNIENPMGYGAESGDMVTIQRVWFDASPASNANYKYIIIGTSNPPAGL